MSYQQYNNNPYAGGPDAEAGNSHEMQPYGQPVAPVSSSPVMSLQDFLSRVSYTRSEIGYLSGDVAQIERLHQQALSSAGGADGSAASQRLDALVDSTSLRNTAIRDQIRALEQDRARTTDGSRNSKDKQVEGLRNYFKKELEAYQRKEAEYRERYREQIARQYRIVNPDATEDEVRQAAETDWGNEGVFQAALRTNRTGQASSVLGNVRARHNELVRIEQTLGELAALFNDMSQLVEQQEVAVNAAEQNAESTVQNIKQGNTQVEHGIEHAKRAKRLKWWCLLVAVLIVLAIALGVGLGVGLAKGSTGK